MDKQIRLGLSGCPGTGRSGIAEELSQSLDVKFIKSSDLTNPILYRDQYDYAPNNFVELFLAEKNREFELVDKKIDIENNCASFVTDRTTLENFAYALVNVSGYTIDEINLLQFKCKNNMRKYTHVFYFPKKSVIKNNNLRTVNTFFQSKVDYIVRGLIKDWKINVIEVPETVIDVCKFVVNKL